MRAFGLCGARGENPVLLTGERRELCFCVFEFKIQRLLICYFKPYSSLCKLYINVTRPNCEFHAVNKNILSFFIFYMLFYYFK
jgi:hypothetical protein